MDQFRWLLRASRWARRPPSTSRVILVLVVIAICLGIAGIDRFVGLPDWMHQDRTDRVRVVR